MTILNDKQIAALAGQGMIIPFTPEKIKSIEHGQVKQSAISYGLQSFGYDLRLSPKEFLVFRHIPGTVVNPKAFNPNNLIPVELQRDEWGEFFVLPAHSYGLGMALERLNIPIDVTCLFIGKSSYARCGIIVNLTPGEAGWRGHLTLEVSNSSDADCRIYANEGICQALFFQGVTPSRDYGSGKYQDQLEAVVLARI